LGQTLHTINTALQGPELKDALIAPSSEVRVAIILVLLSTVIRSVRGRCYIQ